MKKLILVAFIAVALVFAGCGNESNNETSRNTNQAETTAVTSTVSNSNVSSKDNNSNKEHKTLGNINKAKKANAKYVKSTDKKKINSTNLTESQMDELFQSLKEQTNMDDIFARSTVKDFSKDCSVSDFRKLSDKKKSKCYCKVTDDSGRTLYVFFRGSSDESIWMNFLFLDKNNQPVEDNEISNNGDLIKLVNDLDK